MPRHLVLIGLMGVGKTTMGGVLADRLGRELRDSDRDIESETGGTVKQILAEGGVDELRRREADAVFDALAGDEPVVVAAPGGIVLDPDHRHRLTRSDAEIIWLTADPVLPRTADREHRPWLDDDPLGTLERTARERADLYRDVADRVVAVDGLTPDAIADRIIG